MELLTYPTLVQSAYVTVKIGDYTFGMIQKNKSNTHSSLYKVNYPNFIKSITVKKVDGEINQYQIRLVYEVTEHDDPNFVDGVLSSVQYGLIYITYGDYQYPENIYREEEALITDVQQSIDFSNNKINYTIMATGTPFKLMCNNYNYPAKSEKASTELINLLKTNVELRKVFTAMSDIGRVLSENWIPTDDKVVNLPAQLLASPWERLTTLVNCMMASDDNASTYGVAVKTDSETGGSYFEVKKISKQGSLNQKDAFHIDIGYPTENFIKQFNVTTSNGWQLLYNTSVENPDTQYQYSLNSDGILEQKTSPSISRDRNQLIDTTMSNKWWKDMTNFPITAEIQLKGVIAPIVLLAYVDINVVFFGHKHNTSGMYFITEQTDTIDERGYTTMLKLQRVPQENEYYDDTLKFTGGNGGHYTF